MYRHISEAISAKRRGSNNSLHLPDARLISDELISRIIDEALDILERVGVWVRNPKLLRILGEAGAEVDREEFKAFIPFRLVETALETVPRSIRMYDRDGNLAADIGGNSTYFNPMPGAVKVLDHRTSSIRSPVVQDCLDFIKLVDALAFLDIQCGNWYPADMPDEISGCYRNYLVMRYGRKPTWGSMPATATNLQATVKLLEILRGGREALKKRPFLFIVASSVAPLQWNQDACLTLITGAENGIPLGLSSAPSLGSTAPFSIVGGLAQFLAEELGGLVISQLLSPGTPVILGLYPNVTDIRSGNWAGGAVESHMWAMGFAQVCQRLDVPCELISSIADAKSPDAQSAMESMSATLLSALSGGNLIQGAGGMAGAMMSSLVKLVIDNEIAGFAGRLLKGITPHPERLAPDLYRENLLNGDHFLASPHTIKTMRSEIRIPSRIINREGIEAWQTNGAKLAHEVASEEVDRILKDHQSEPLDPALAKALEDVMLSYAQNCGLKALPDKNLDG